jgi:hypothetical protein
MPCRTSCRCWALPARARRRCRKAARG